MNVSEISSYPKVVKVPETVFNRLLEQIASLSEMQCVLRMIYLSKENKGINRHKRPAHSVTLEELLTDKLLVKIFSSKGIDPSAEIEKSAKLIVQHGIFTLGKSMPSQDSLPEFAHSCQPDMKHETLFILNIKTFTDKQQDIVHHKHTNPQKLHMDSLDKPNIYGLYEDNIGMLNPIIAELLKDAEQTYPQTWIEEAFTEAIARNKRNWKYIAAILKNWEREGKNNGGTRRYPQKNRY